MGDSIAKTAINKVGNFLRTTLKKANDLADNSEKKVQRADSSAPKDNYTPTSTSSETPLLNGKQAAELKVAWKGQKAKPAGPSKEQLRVKKVGIQDALVLEKAMAGIGTDEKKILDTLHGKSFKEREAIRDFFKKRTGKDLEKALKEELSGSDLKLANSYLEQGRESAADKLFRAVDGAGTDETLITRTLEGMSEKELSETKREYYNKHGEHLEARLKGELSFSTEKKALGMLDDGHLNTREQLDAAMSGLTDEEAIFNALKSADEETRKGLMKDKKFLSDLKSEMSGSELETARQLLAKGKLDTEGSLRVAMAGNGTDEEAIYKVLQGASREEREAIRKDPGLMKLLKEELTSQEEGLVEQLFKNGKFDTRTQVEHAMAGLGRTDKHAIMKALNEATPEERRELLGDDKFRDDLKAELEGNSLGQALDILRNGPHSAEEKIKWASKGLGTDNKSIFDALSGASKEERIKMTRDPEMRGRLKSELSGADLRRAEILLERGEVSDVEELGLAMMGNGTDEQAIFKILGSLESDYDKQKLMRHYQRTHGTNLMDDLKSDLTSSEFRQAELALRTKAGSVDEAMQRLDADMKRDRDGGGWTAVSSTILDRFSDRGRDMDDRAREMRAVVRSAELKGRRGFRSTLTDLREKRNEFDHATADARDSKGAIANYANLGLSVVAATAVEVSSLGAGTPLAAAMLANAVGKVTLNKTILGQDYDAIGSDGMKDFVSGGLEVAVAHGANSMATKYAKGAGMADSAKNGFISGSLGGATSGAANTALSDKTWDQGTKTGGRRVFEHAFWGGLVGASVGPVIDTAYAGVAQSSLGAGLKIKIEKVGKGFTVPKLVNGAEDALMLTTAREMASKAAKKIVPAVGKTFTSASRNSAKTELSSGLDYAE
jgi:annexin-like protein